MFGICGLKHWQFLTSHQKKKKKKSVPKITNVKTMLQCSQNKEKSILDDVS